MIFEPKQLTVALAQVSAAVHTKGTMPIYSHVLLRSADGVATLTACNTELQLLAVIGPCDETVDVALPYAKVNALVSALTSPVEITLDGNQARIKSGRSRYTLATLPGGQFPLLEQRNSVWRATLPGTLIEALLRHVAPCMANGDVRYYLNGALLHAEDDTLTCVGTDGHRLGHAWANVETTNALQVILPRNTVKRLLGLCKGAEAVSIAAGREQVTVTAGDVTLTSKIIDARYPDWTRVIPTKLPHRAIVKRSDLLAAVKGALTISSEKYRAVRLTFDPSAVVVDTYNEEAETAQIEVAADYTGERLVIAFNGEYLAELLSAMDAEDVTVDMATSDISALLQGADGARYILMPVKI